MAAFIFLCSVPVLGVGSWTKLTHSPPSQISLMLLLSDGTVVAADVNTSSNWYRLTPDIHGSYINGTWTTLASMHDTRLYYSSQILTNGRLFVAGGEYGTGAARAEVYDPVSNVWTQVPVPVSLLNPSAASPEVGADQAFYDSESKVLPNGSVLIPPVAARNVGGTLIYYPASNAWSNGPTFFKSGYPDQDEASWVKLPDNSILTIDPDGTTSERFISSLNEWIDDSTVPVAIYDSVGGEMGPAFLVPDGRAFFMGATGHTAFYTPSGGTSPGTWAAGPDIPGGLTTPDAAGAMMVNGRILCAVGPALFTNSGGVVQYTGPTAFYEFDPVSNTFTAAPTPGGTANYPPYETGMLNLPDGTVLYSRQTTAVYVYKPDGTPVASGTPGINSVTGNSDGSYQLTGTLLNGISEGAAYGDDAQMNTDYPLVRLTNSATTNVYYARTYNWSSTGVMTGTNLVSTQFSLPAGLPVPGTYSLVVTANGFSSTPVTLTLPLSLELTRGTNSHQVVLSWPSVPANAGLETSSNLSSSVWLAVTNSATVISNRALLTNSASASSAFFRLHVH